MARKSLICWLLILDTVYGAVHLSSGITNTKQLKKPMALRADRVELIPKHERLLLKTKHKDEDTFSSAFQVTDTAWVDPHAMFEYEPPKEPKLEASKTEKHLVLGNQQKPDKKSADTKETATTSKLLVATDIAPCNLTCDCQEVRDELHTCKLSLADEDGVKKCGDIQHLRRCVKILANNLPHEPAENSPLHFQIRLTLTMQDYQIIENFLKSPCSHASELEEVLVRMIGSSSPFEDADSYLWWTWALNIPAESAYILLAGLLGTALVFTLLIGLSFWQVICRIFIMLFVVSTLWHWNHLYHVQLARKHAVLEQGDVPPECRPSQMTWWLSIKLWARSSFTFSEDPCAKYYEAILVDPFWEVTPLMALSETIWKFLLHPLQLCGKFIGVFIRTLCSEIPIAALPVVAAILAFVFILILIMICRYRIQLPFLLGTLEPVHNTYPDRIHQTVVRESERAISGGQRPYFESIKPQNATVGDHDSNESKICDVQDDKPYDKETEVKELEISNSHASKIGDWSAEKANLNERSRREKLEVQGTSPMISVSEGSSYTESVSSRGYDSDCNKGSGVPETQAEL